MIETTSAGAAFLAGLGAGIFSNLEDIKKAWKVEKTFTPKLSEAEREARLARWTVAVRRTMLK
jgi:glycerol kinase